MSKTITCQADVVQRGRYTYVLLPADIRAQFGRPKGHLYLDATLNGVQVRGRLVTAEKDKPALFLAKDVQMKLGYAGGEMCLSASFTAMEAAAEKPVKPDVMERSGMDALAAITGRASIRKYTAQPVEQKHIDTILNAGFCAPSADNKRPWEFVVVRDAAKRAAFAEAFRYAGMAKDAPVCIAVCGDAVRQGEEEFLLEDCASAVQNMLLAAHALDLGAVWCGIWAKSGYRKTCAEMLALPDKVVPVALLCIGWPDEARRRPPRYVPGRVHYEQW